MTNARWWLVVLVAAAGCSSKSDPGTQIGSSGGVVTAANGTSVSVPQGALAAPVTITVDIVSESVPGSVGSVYKLGPEGQTFSMPVSVTLDFAADRLPTGKTAADVVVLTAPSGSSEFTSLGGEALDATHVVATTTHFSIFGAATATATVTDAGGDGAPACVALGKPCADAVLCCGGATCQGAVCASPPTCAAGQTACNGSCVSTGTDPNNCGACGYHCGTTAPVCINGACSPPAA